MSSTHVKRICVFLFILVSSAFLLGLGFFVAQAEKPLEGTDFNDILVYCDDIPDLKIRLCRTSDEEDEELYLFLPYSDKKWLWEVPQNMNLYIDGSACSSGDTLLFSDTSDKHLFALGSGDQFTEIRYLNILTADHMPAVSVELDADDFFHITDEAFPGAKSMAKMLVFDSASKEQCNIRCYLGGHGNSTWAFGKKPFEIKSDKSISLLGLKQCSAWNLLANRMDCSNLKDRIVYEAASATDMEYSTGCEYVNLYINEIYQGLYLLTEKPATGDGIITFYDDIEDENLSLTHSSVYTPVVQNKNTKEEIRYYNVPSPPDISGSYLMEFDSYEEDLADHSIESWFRTDISKDEYGSEWMVLLKQPKIASKDEVLYLKDYISETEKAIYGENGVDPVSGLDFRDRIDAYSWSMSYLFLDFFANHDTSGGSLFFYKKRDDPVLYSGPVWDYDKSMTDNYYDDDPFPWYGRAETFLWYDRLNQYPDFHNNVVEDYRTELSPILEEIITTKLPVWRQEIEYSARMDEKRWNRGDGYEEDRADAVTEWLIRRKALFDTVWIDGFESPYSGNIY